MSNGFCNDMDNMHDAEAHRLRREADEAFYANDEDTCEYAIERLYDLFDKEDGQAGSRHQRGVGSLRGRVC